MFSSRLTCSFARYGFHRMVADCKNLIPQRANLTTNTQINDNNAKYTYSVSDGNGLLSKDQRDFYEENGYLVIKNALSSKDIETYWKRFNDLASGKVSPEPGLILQKELASAKKGGTISENTLYKVQELYADPVLFEYCRHPKILDYVECFTGPNIVAIHTMLINKPPDTGTKSSRHPLHQDLHYFPIRPADKIICAWSAMERVHKDNGCLVAVPGSHRGDHLEHDYPKWEGGVNKFYYGITDLSLHDKRVHLEMDPGDCVLFHPILIHGSGINRTKGFRKAISCHYAAAECEYIDVRGTIQEKLANEIIDTYLRKLNMAEAEIEYWYMWKLRSRLVRGEEKTL